MEADQEVSKEPQVHKLVIHQQLQPRHTLHHLSHQIKPPAAVTTIQHKEKMIFQVDHLEPLDIRLNVLLLVQALLDHKVPQVLVSLTQELKLLPVELLIQELKLQQLVHLTQELRLQQLEHPTQLQVSFLDSDQQDLLAQLKDQQRLELNQVS